MVEKRNREKRNAKSPRGDDPLPPGKVRCYISKRVYDESETVELSYNGVTVRVHKKYARL